MSQGPLSITYVGHATLLIEIGAVRILTDPLLRGRISHIRRLAGAPDPAVSADVDAVLISHVHGDHLDPASLREVRARRVLVPAGAQTWQRLDDVDGVEPVGVGERIRVGAVEVQAVPAVHGRRRGPGSRVAADPLGYVIDGGTRVYFAGDTDLFAGMSEFAPVDVALVPVWGWGPRVGMGHMDPLRAAQAVRVLAPRVAVPIHWGTYLADTVLRHRSARLLDPPRTFAAAVAEIAPDVHVEILRPGATLRLDALRSTGGVRRRGGCEHDSADSQP